MIRSSSIRLVGELIKSRGQTLRVINEDYNLEMCSTLLSSFNISRAPVVDDNGDLVGLLSERDIRLAISIPYFHSSFLNKPENVENLRKLKAKDIMSDQPVCVDTDTPIVDVAKLMNFRNISGIPLVKPETNNVVGMCTQTDLVDHLITLLSE